VNESTNLEPRLTSARVGRRCLVVAAFLTVAGVWTIRELGAQQSKAEVFSKYVDASGEISLPDDFETTFVHLGSVAVAPKADQPVDELHGTYTRSEDLAAFLRDGKFPDGAVLVKDVRSTSNSILTTGAAAYGADVKVWFVMIKDSKGRFPENELWGDGWGWGLFEGKDRTKQVATSYRTDCRTCHVPAKKQDWVFTQCYPALSAKAKVEK
jgi:cytochrome c